MPEFGAGWGCKVVLTNGAYNITQLVVQSPTGERQTLRMPLDVYLGVVAATNMKQRTRKQIEYYHADRLNYAVLGTPNRLEYDQGFFVKNGDGAADIKPLAHLYKTQVYALAAHLGLPEEIRSRPPTTDTWSLAQSQEEFYFSVPYPMMDLCLFGLEHGMPAAAVAERVGPDAGAGRDRLARHRGQARAPPAISTSRRSSLRRCSRAEAPIPLQHRPFRPPELGQIAGKIPRALTVLKEELGTMARNGTKASAIEMDPVEARWRPWIRLHLQ